MKLSHQQFLANAITAILVVVLGLQLAWWGWHLFAPAAVARSSNSSIGAAFEPITDYKKTARALFGDDGSAPAKVDNAAENSDIILKGVFAVDGKTLSAAVVNLGAKDQVVQINQPLSNGAKLLEVHPEYIVVSRAGTSEKIALASFRAAKAAGANSMAAASAAANAGFRLNIVAAGTNTYSLSRQELNNVLQDPRQLEFLGRINNAPNGGIKVDDAPANSLSAKLGLRAGDIIINVNGQPVMGTGDLARLYQQFATISEVRMEVKRAGIPIQLSYVVKN